VKSIKRQTVDRIKSNLGMKVRDQALNQVLIHVVRGVQSQIEDQIRDHIWTQTTENPNEIS
jgi:hypothetical protein